MKKVISIILSFILIFSLAGCSVKVSTTNSIPNTVANDTAENNDLEGSIYTGDISEQIIIDNEDDVTITLKDVNMTLEDSCIAVENAKSVTIILEGDNYLISTGEEVKTIKSDADLIFKGEGSLTVKSTDTCIKSSTNLTVESGNYTLEAGEDGDGLRANETLTINGGLFSINAGECLEATHIIIDDGELNLYSTDDAINASEKSELGLTPCLTINGGEIIINMGEGDTDGIDSNGDIIINGGVIIVNAQSAFDWDGNLEFNGGTVYINGEEVTEITNQFEGEFAPQYPGNMQQPGEIGPNNPGQPPEGQPTPPDGKR